MKDRLNLYHETPSAIGSTARQLMLGGISMAVALTATADTALTGSVIASGGNTSNSAGLCFRLQSVLGQAAAGDTTTGGNFTLQGGFLAGRKDQDSLFRYGFEVCS